MDFSMIEIDQNPADSPSVGSAGTKTTSSQNTAIASIKVG
jgi:hypothetical protein